MKVRKLTKRWLTSHQASCADQVRTWATMFPDGMALTAENVWKCYEAELDVIWAAYYLMTKGQRRRFIVFTLCQRQPHLVILLEGANLLAQAEAIRTLDWKNMAHARGILGDMNAAWISRTGDTARAAAFDAVKDAVRDMWSDTNDSMLAAVLATEKIAGVAAHHEQVEWCIHNLIEEAK